MTESKTPVVAAVGILANNWNSCIEGREPIIVNPAATHESLIAWCWGEAKSLADLAEALDEGCDLQGHQVTSLFWNRLTPLVSVLEHLGNVTHRQRAENPGEAA